MYKIITAILVICLILGLGIWEQVFLHESFNELHDRAVVIEEKLIAKDYDAALLSANEMLEWWRDKRDIIELTSPHNEVKDHVNLLAQLEGYLISEQYDDAIATTYAIREDAHNKLNILAYRLKNVF